MTVNKSTSYCGRVDGSVTLPAGVVLDTWLRGVLDLSADDGVTLSQTADFTWARPRDSRFAVGRSAAADGMLDAGVLLQYI